MGSAQLGAKLTDDETVTIAAFLTSLAGRQPKVDYPILPPSMQHPSAAHELTGRVPEICLRPLFAPIPLL
jgi:hypothetical protein